MPFATLTKTIRLDIRNCMIRFAVDSKESFMPDTVVLKEGISAWWQYESRRELTKLECGLLGALSATVVLMLIVALGLQLSILALSIQLT